MPYIQEDQEVAINKPFRFTFLLVLLLFTSYGCKAQALPFPTVSANADTVTAALQQVGLSWTIATQETLEDARTVYTLHDPDGKLAAFVTSIVKDERRTVDISCMPYQEIESVSNPLPPEQWEQVVRFATLLYGGFQNDRQVYEHFKSDYGHAKNTTTVSQPKPGRGTADLEERSMWQAKIENATCTVLTDRPYHTMPQTYLNTVRIENDAAHRALSIHKLAAQKRSVFYE